MVFLAILKFGSQKQNLAAETQMAKMSTVRDEVQIMDLLNSRLDADRAKTERRLEEALAKMAKIDRERHEEGLKYQQDIAARNEERESMRKRITDLEKEVTGEQEARRALEEALAATEKRLEVEQKKNTAMQAQLDKLQQSYEDLKKDHEKLKADYEKVVAERDELKEAAATHDEGEAKDAG